MAAREAVSSEYGAGGPATTMEVAQRLCPPGQPRRLPPLLREREGEGHPKMVRTGRWKYVYDSTAPAEELYDLEVDPWELTNLALDPAHVQTVSELRRLPWRQRPRRLARLLVPSRRVLAARRLKGRHALTVSEEKKFTQNK